MKNIKNWESFNESLINDISSWVKNIINKIRKVEKLPDIYDDDDTNGTELNEYEKIAKDILDKLKTLSKEEVNKCIDELKLDVQAHTGPNDRVKFYVKIGDEGFLVRSSIAAKLEGIISRSK